MMRCALFSFWVFWALASCGGGSGGGDGFGGGDVGINTGNAATIDAALVLQSADMVLGTSAQMALFAALPGALTPGGGELVLKSASEEVSVMTNNDGTFAVSLEVALGAEVSLRYDGPEFDAVEAQIDVGDDFSSVPAPFVGSSSAVGPIQNGEVSVDLSVLMGSSPPYVVVNENEAAVLRAESVTIVNIDAMPGDSICIFSVADDKSSLRHCETTF